MVTLGIDFGTTNTSVAINEDGRVRMLELDVGAPNAHILRSALFFDLFGGIHVGQQAIDHYVEDVTSGRFLRSIKTLLPSTLFTETTIGARRYDAVRIVSTFLSALHQTLTERGISADCVTIGRPVVFSADPQIDRMAEARLRQAAEHAGFKNISFQLEPIAAALSFENSLARDETRTVLVADFGGGTTDFTVMRVGKGRSLDRRKDILALGGVYVGGDTFDSELMWHSVGPSIGRNARYRNSSDRWRPMPESVTQLARSWHTIPLLRERKTRERILRILDTTTEPEAIQNLLRLIDDNSGIALFQAVERAKCELSLQDAAWIEFDGLAHVVKELVSVEAFDEVVRHGIDSIERCLLDVMRDSGVAPGDIDNVSLAGGTSQVPAVQKMLSRHFGAQKLTSQDAFTSVAFGLGLSTSWSFAA